MGGGRLQLGAARGVLEVCVREKWKGRARARGEWKWVEKGFLEGEAREMQRVEFLVRL